MQLLAEAEGNDGVIIYIENPKAKKELPRNKNVLADQKLVERLSAEFGVGNVVVVV